MRKKHVRRDSKMCCCCCCRFCCGAPTTDERILAPVLHDASQIDYCRYGGRASLPPITSRVEVGLFLLDLLQLFASFFVLFSTLTYKGVCSVLLYMLLMLLLGMYVCSTCIHDWKYKVGLDFLFTWYTPTVIIFPSWSRQYVCTAPAAAVVVVVLTLTHRYNAVRGHRTDRLQ